MLSLPLLPVVPLLTCFAGVAFSFFDSLERPLFVLVSITIAIAPVVCLGILCVTSARDNDNLSLALLVISNLYPAVLTLVVIGLRTWKYDGAKQYSSSTTIPTSSPERDISLEKVGTRSTSRSNESFWSN